MLRGATDPQEAEELLGWTSSAPWAAGRTREVLEAAAERLGVTARAPCGDRHRHGPVRLPCGAPLILPLSMGGNTPISGHRSSPIFTPPGILKVTAHQFERFQQVLRFLQFMECDPGMIHCCNSLAFGSTPSIMDAVRLGSVFLGRVSYAEEAGLSRVGWVEAPIQEVREVQAGSNVATAAPARCRRTPTWPWWAWAITTALP